MRVSFCVWRKINMDELETKNITKDELIEAIRKAIEMNLKAHFPDDKPGSGAAMGAFRK